MVSLGIFFKDQQQDNRTGSDKEGIEPWLPKSSLQPEQGTNEAVEKFIAELYCKLFDTKNRRKVKQNLSREEKLALRKLSTWNKDTDCPRVIRVQDKGSKFVIDWKSTYIENISNYIGDRSIFRQEIDNPTEKHKMLVNQWAEKWLEVGDITQDEADWVKTPNAKPGYIYANIKTHKKGVPCRLIMASNGSPIKYQARWVEWNIKEHAQQHKAYIKDTKALLQHIEQLNSTKASFSESSVLVGWDIKNFYSNCQTDLCIKAVGKALDNRPPGTLPCKQCILETLQITMSCNNGIFLEKHFAQIQAATIGGPESAGFTDIFCAVYIDKKAMEGGP